MSTVSTPLLDTHLCHAILDLFFQAVDIYACARHLILHSGFIAWLRETINMFTMNNYKDDQSNNQFKVLRMLELLNKVLRFSILLEKEEFDIKRNDEEEEDEDEDDGEDDMNVDENEEDEEDENDGTMVKHRKHERAHRLSLMLTQEAKLTVLFLNNQIAAFFTSHSGTSFKNDIVENTYACLFVELMWTCHLLSISDSYTMFITDDG
jgi:hypothetical protein